MLEREAVQADGVVGAGAGGRRREQRAGSLSRFLAGPVTHIRNALGALGRYVIEFSCLVSLSAWGAQSHDLGSAAHF